MFNPACGHTCVPDGVTSSCICEWHHIRCKLRSVDITLASKILEPKSELRGQTNEISFICSSAMRPSPPTVRYVTKRGDEKS